MEQLLFCKAAHNTISMFVVYFFVVCLCPV